LSPLLANIALSVLDEHFQRDWKPGGRMDTEKRRHWPRKRGHATWRLVRYADDFVIMVFGTRDHVDSVREEAVHVLVPMGLRLSPVKTRIVHLDEGFDFLGFRIRRRRKMGTVDRGHVYTFIGDRPLRSLRAKIRALTRRLSQVPLKDDQPDPARLGRLLPRSLRRRPGRCGSWVWMTSPSAGDTGTAPSWLI
jgi:RNA-directed DNA polymerase